VGGTEIRLRVVEKAGKHPRPVRARIDGQRPTLGGDVFAGQPGRDEMVVGIDVKDGHVLVQMLLTASHEVDGGKGTSALAEQATHEVAQAAVVKEAARRRV